jgi:hypothetical protein
LRYHTQHDADGTRNGAWQAGIRFADGNGSLLTGPSLVPGHQPSQPLAKPLQPPSGTDVVPSYNSVRTELLIRRSRLNGMPLVNLRAVREHFWSVSGGTDCGGATTFLRNQTPGLERRQIKSEFDEHLRFGEPH